jgi:hypothetical protein
MKTNTRVHWLRSDGAPMSEVACNRHLRSVVCNVGKIEACDAAAEECDSCYVDKKHALSVDCPACETPAGKPCMSNGGFHSSRAMA